MKKSESDYHISFFKPTTERARFNRNLVIWLASVWFIAIFGFQIALRIIEKPVPEPSYQTFQSSWGSIINGNASEKDLQGLGTSTLSVLGKIAITPEERTALSNAMSWAIMKLVPAEKAEETALEVKKFTALKSDITDINDSDYKVSKLRLSEQFSPLLGLDKLDPRTRILPVELVYTETLNESSVDVLPSIMKKYLIHNRSVLTDTIFLGFPFHYFYTAVFLLILFVGLCWLYCVRSDRRNIILGIEE